MPPTLDTREITLFIKRLRKKMGPARPLRHFSCGEYGEQNGRPHYHALLFGLSSLDRDAVHDAWGKGITQCLDADDGGINYVAGYTAKKVGWKRDVQEYVDPDTGELYTWQPPFIQMSRRPGIGGEARKFAQSWRLYAINNGHMQPVPRFLHEAWKKTATEEELAELAYEKQQLTLTRDNTEERRRDREKIAIAKQRKAAERRTA